MRAPEYDEEWVEVWTLQLESSLEDWADDTDSQGDYTIVGGSPMTVEVRDDQGEESTWELSGETQAVYHAREL